MTRARILRGSGCHAAVTAQQAWHLRIHTNCFQFRNTTLIWASVKMGATLEELTKGIMYTRFTVSMRCACDSSAMMNSVMSCDAQGRP